MPGKYAICKSIPKVCTVSSVNGKLVGTFSMILIVLSCAFSFFSGFAWPVPSVLYLFGGVAANV
jgi:hypothetical protein